MCYDETQGLGTVYIIESVGTCSIIIYMHICLCATHGLGYVCVWGGGEGYVYVSVWGYVRVGMFECACVRESVEAGVM